MLSKSQPTWKGTNETAERARNGSRMAHLTELYTTGGWKSSMSPARSRQRATGRLPSLLFFVRRQQLFPHIAVLGPLRGLQAGDLKFGDLQRPVPVRADVLEVRPAKLQHLAPGARCNRHPKPPRAHSAAIALIQDRKVNQAAGDQKDEPRRQGPGQVEAEKLAAEQARARQQQCDAKPDAAKEQTRHAEFSRKPTPIAHTSI